MSLHSQITIYLNGIKSGPLIHETIKFYSIIQGSLTLYFFPGNISKYCLILCLLHGWKYCYVYIWILPIFIFIFCQFCLWKKTGGHCEISFFPLRRDKLPLRFLHLNVVSIQKSQKWEFKNKLAKIMNWLFL